MINNITRGVEDCLRLVSYNMETVFNKTNNSTIASVTNIWRTSIFKWKQIIKISLRFHISVKKCHWNIIKTTKNAEEISQLVGELKMLSKNYIFQLVYDKITFFAWKAIVYMQIMTKKIQNPSCNYYQTRPYVGWPWSRSAAVKIQRSPILYIMTMKLCISIIN